MYGTVDSQSDRRKAATTWLRMIGLPLCGLTLALLLAPSPAFASEGIDGARMSLLWAIPFAGILLCIATGPVFFPHVWEHNYGKFALFWSAMTIVPLYLTSDPTAVTATLAHTALLEYMPFILLLLALFTVAGGIYLEGNLHDSVFTNTVLLGIGTLAASIVGTTGASMILIRPLIRANDDRRRNAHVVIFFIFLVSNIGGALSPLGDPPLFIGFLKGVDFFWTTTHLFAETATIAGIVLAVFFFVDLYFHRTDDRLGRVKDPTPDKPLKLHGLVNIPMLLLIIFSILFSAWWKPGVEFHILGAKLELQDLMRDLLLVASAFLSMWLTPKAHRAANEFNWGPIKEVAILFACIFTCIAPVIAMLHAGEAGPFAVLLKLVTTASGEANNAAYFWLTGVLSSFLDNAPTYLVFFELAGGDPQKLMTAGALTLAAISSGAVYMGANTYIGNAPNFMVYAIARHGGVRMPSFFGYMIWSGLILVPCFLIATWIFFH